MKARTAPKNRLDSGAPWREMAGRLDASAPTPLYHQLAMAIRWEIGMGRLLADVPLLPLRAAAAALGVNYHTVRQAYAELVALGVVTSARRRGTVVRQHASPQGLVTSAEPWLAIECCYSQATQLAEELHTVLGVPAVPWQLGWPEPPPGQLVTTNFHATEVGEAWPHRGVCKVPLALHESLPQAISTAAMALVANRVVIVERDQGTGCALTAEIAPTLRRLGLAIETRVAEVAALVASADDSLLLVAPRVFAVLPWQLQVHPRVLELRFAVDRRAWPRLRTFLDRRTRSSS